MGFFGRLQFGWKMGMTSLGVVTRDKTLMLFPILSGICSVLMVLVFVFGFGVDNLLEAGRQSAEAANAAPGQPSEVPPVFYVLAFGIYFAVTFVTVYFNVALLGAAQLSLAGKDTSLGDGLGVANQHLGKILGWALLSGTVGLLLNALESNQKIGSIVRSILGAAWAVITYFVVPVMIFENKTPPEAIGRSVGLMKQTWGENAGAQVGIGLATFVFLVGAVLLFVAGSMLVPQAAPVLVTLLVLTAPVIILLGMAAKAVLAVALYEFATNKGDGKVFKREELRAAFR